MGIPLAITESEFNVSLRNKRRVPIFPHGFITEFLEQAGDFLGGTLIRHFELSGGMVISVCPFVNAFTSDSGRWREDFSPRGLMKLVAAGPGIAARFGVAAGTHQRDAQRNQAVPEPGWLACGEDQPDIGKHEAECADQLRQIAIGHSGQRLKFAGAWTQTRE